MLWHLMDHSGKGFSAKNSENHTEKPWRLWGGCNNLHFILINQVDVK